MIKSVVKIALINLRRQRLTALVQFIGLTLSIAVAGFAFIYVKQEASFNASWDDADLIHRLLVERDQAGQDGLSRSSLIQTSNRVYFSDVASYFGTQISEITRIVTLPTKFSNLDSPVMTELAFVDEGYIEIFNLDVTEGSFDRVLNRPGFIALEETYAEKLNIRSPIGSRIEIESQTGALQFFEVAAIYRTPDRISSNINFEQITSINEYSSVLFGDLKDSLSWTSEYQIWAKFKEGIDAQQLNSVHRELSRNIYSSRAGLSMKDDTSTSGSRFIWQSVTSLHFNPADDEQIYNKGSSIRVMAFTAVGLFVLIAGCTNAISLGLAGALENKKNVGIYKSLGASPKVIFLQYLFESILLSYSVILPALGIIQLFLPLIENLLSFSTSVTINGTDILLIVAICTGVGLVNSLYPGLVMASYLPHNALTKQGSDSGRGAHLDARGWLTASQYFFSAGLLVLTLTFALQLVTTKSQPFGFSANNLLILGLSDSQEYGNREALKVELEKIPEVESISWLRLPPTFDDSNIKYRYSYSGTPNSASGAPALNASIGENFFLTANIPLVAGNFFTPSDQNLTNVTVDDSEEKVTEVLINEVAARSFGFRRPKRAVGQFIYKTPIGTASDAFPSERLYVKGVISNHMFHSVLLEPFPVVYTNLARSSALMLLRFNSSAKSVISERVQGVAESVNGKSLSFLRYIDSDVDSTFRDQRNEIILLSICGAITIGISFVGIYALSKFVATSGQKEAAIRRVLGASVFAIISLFCWRLIRYVLFGCILCWPLSYYLTSIWIEQFPYQIDKSWIFLICLSVTFILCLISLITVTVTTFKTILRAPTLSLKSE